MAYIPGGPGADSLEGDGGSDTIVGFGGDDTLRGLAGNDTIDGGDGSDLIDGGADVDTVTYASATGSVAVNLANGLGFDTEGLGQDTLVGIENLIGSQHDDAIIGDGANNVIDGGGGDDSLDGGDGLDTVTFARATVDLHIDLRVTGGQDTGFGEDTLSGFETLIGGSGDDTLIGDDQANRIEGGAGADSLEGGAGVDTLVGGVDDTVAGGLGRDVMNAGTVDYTDYVNEGTIHPGVLVRLGDGGGSGGLLNGTDSLGALVYAIIGTQYADTIVSYDTDTHHEFHGADGNDSMGAGGGDDVMYGEAGDDTLRADEGSDTLDGGADTDTATFAGYDTSDRLIASLAKTGPQDFGNLGFDVLVSIESLNGNDDTRDKFTGNDVDNVLSGFGASDQLYGAGGNDRLLGGAGDDTLVGGEGNDTMDGGDGVHDLADYSSAAAAVKVDLSNNTNVQNTAGAGSDLLKNIEWLIGSAFDDTLKGGAAGDSLDGGAGADSLVGQGGNDTLLSGAGNDTFSGGANVDTVLFVTGHAITVDLKIAGPQNTGDGMDAFDTVENLTGGKGNDHLIGDGNANVLLGGGGVDTLEGGGGADTLDAGGDKRDVMLGGLGDDLIQNGRASYDDIAGPVTIDMKITGAQDTGSAGTDTLVNVTSVIGSDQGDTILGDFFNNGLTGGAGADSLSGDIGADVLIGGASDDTLDGGAGADRLAGGAGDDLLLGGQGKDTASYSGVSAGVVVDLSIVGSQNTLSAGFDTLQSMENVLGSRFDDKIYGSDADNVVTGGGGADRLSGRGGADIFVYDAISDSTAAAADLVNDLTSQDKLDLSLIDADATTTGDEAFHIISTFTKHAAEIVLHYDSAKDLSSLKADVDGDGSVDLLINFRGDVTGMSDGWLL